MKIAAIAVAALLSGCASYGPIIRPGPPQTDPRAVLADKMQSLGNLHGQNIQTAVAALGYPDSQRQIVGDMVYIWSSRQDTQVPDLYGNPMRLTAYCIIQIGVDPITGVIKNTTWEGNVSGCARYANALSY